MDIWAVQRVDPAPIDGPRLSEGDLADRVNWPFPAEWIVRFDLEDRGWMLDVEVEADPDGVHHLTGIVIRSGIPTSPSGTNEDPWLEGGEYEPLVVRDVQQLLLGRYVRAALAIVDDPITGEGRREARRILLPSGMPDEGVGPEWYAELLENAEELEKQGYSPVQEIANRKGVSPNVVSQWLNRARSTDEKE